MKKSSSGFTIVELLIVIVIIAVLASIAVLAFSGVRNRASNTAKASTIGSYVKMLASYRSIHGKYPGPDPLTSNNITCFDGGTSCWNGADAAKSANLNTELLTVVSNVPSLPLSTFNYTAADGYYIAYILSDTSNCPVIGGTTPGVSSVASPNPLTICRVILPTP